MVSKKQLSQGLKKLGVHKKQYLMVHSALSSFGHLEDGAPTLIQTLQNIITEEGLIIMPTFTYGQEPFDIKNTPSKTGFITETFRKSKNVYRSEHPTHSIAAWGNDASSFVEGHKTESAFSKSSPLFKFGLRGDILLVGVDYTSCSMIHVGQEIADVAYLDRPKQVSFSNGEVFTARRAGCSLGFNKIESYITNDKVKTITIGNSNITLVRAPLILRTTYNMLTENPLSLSCNNRDCFACNEAKEMINASNTSNFNNRY